MPGGLEILLSQVRDLLKAAQNWEAPVRLALNNKSVANYCQFLLTLSSFLLRECMLSRVCPYVRRVVNCSS